MQSATFDKSSKAQQDLYWANVWFGKMAQFHGKAPTTDWNFAEGEVIAFLRSKRDADVHAWKRVKIIEGVLVYRRMVQELPIDCFQWIRDKLQEVVQTERAQQEGYGTIEEAVGFINPNEPDAIREFRRALRKDGRALKTERSYVGKLKAFMAARGLTCLDDFQGIGGDDVEAHLTDLAVDGNVAPSTQNAAFHALLKFFTLGCRTRLPGSIRRHIASIVGSTCLRRRDFREIQRRGDSIGITCSRTRFQGI